MSPDSSSESTQRELALALSVTLGLWTGMSASDTLDAHSWWLAQAPGRSDIVDKVVVPFKFLGVG